MSFPSICQTLCAWPGRVALGLKSTLTIESPLLEDSRAAGDYPSKVPQVYGSPAGEGLGTKVITDSVASDVTLLHE